MKKVFVGLLFLFLHFKINGVDLLPAFVGYLLILVGMREEREYPSRRATGYLAAAGALATGLLWFWGIFGGELPLPIGAFFQLLITYRLVLWAEEMSQAGERARLLRKSWYVLTIGVALTFVLGLLELEASSVAALLVSLGAAAYYIYNYYRLWKELEQKGPGDGLAA